jgi:3-phenylpropionate/cinnamic acid dioxygenase small subunit
VTVLDETITVDEPRVPSNDLLHGAISDFLIDEAMLLDKDRFPEWLALLADDLVYRMPVRLTVLRDDGPGFDPTMSHFEEDYASIALKVKRLESKSAWAEDPPSRVRRYVTNVVVHRTDRADEFHVTSYLLLVRNRWDNPTFDLVPAEREDLLRRTDAGWRIGRRTIWLDQSVLGTPNLAVFF